MLFLLLLRPFIAVATPGLYPDCLDENGNPVDWWFLMKEATGSRYVYLDSMMMANKQLGGSRLSGDIQSPTSPLVRTLAKANPLYHPEYVYRAYNDQPPLDLTASDGHSKTVSVYRNFSAEESFRHFGTVLNDEGQQREYTRGIFIQHSIPRFPLPPQQWTPYLRGYNMFSSNVDANAQHAFCISIADETVSRAELGKFISQHQYQSRASLQAVIDYQHEISGGKPFSSLSVPHPRYLPNTQVIPGDNRAFSVSSTKRQYEIKVNFLIKNYANLGRCIFSDLFPSWDRPIDAFPELKFKALHLLMHGWFMNQEHLKAADGFDGSHAWRIKAATGHKARYFHRSTDLKSGLPLIVGDLGKTRLRFPGDHAERAIPDTMNHAKFGFLYGQLDQAQYSTGPRPYHYHGKLYDLVPLRFILCDLNIFLPRWSQPKRLGGILEFLDINLTKQLEWMLLGRSADSAVGPVCANRFLSNSGCYRSNVYEVFDQGYARNGRAIQCRCNQAPQPYVDPIDDLTNRMASMTWSEYQRPIASYFPQPTCRCQELQATRLSIYPQYTGVGLEPAPVAKPKKQYKCVTPRCFAYAFECHPEYDWPVEGTISCDWSMESHESQGPGFRVCSTMMFLRQLLAVLLLAGPVASDLYPVCLDKNGDAVDWWFMMKEAHGSRYIYLDSKMMADGFEFVPVLSDDIQSVNSPLVRTLRHADPIRNPDYVFRAYNDQPPENLSAGNGHSKTISAYRAFNAEESERIFGASHTDSGYQREYTRGIFVQHSIPQFPRPPEKWTPVLRGANMFSSNIEANAQHAFCISLSDETVSDNEMQKYLEQNRYHSRSPLQAVLDYQREISGGKWFSAFTKDHPRYFHHAQIIRGDNRAFTITSTADQYEIKVNLLIKNHATNGQCIFSDIFPSWDRPVDEFPDLQFKALHLLMHGWFMNKYHLGPSEDYEGSHSWRIKTATGHKPRYFHRSTDRISRLPLVVGDLGKTHLRLPGYTHQLNISATQNHAKFGFLYGQVDEPQIRTDPQEGRAHGKSYDLVPLRFILSDLNIFLPCWSQPRRLGGMLEFLDIRLSQILEIMLIGGCIESPVGQVAPNRFIDNTGRYRHNVFEVYDQGNARFGRAIQCRCNQDVDEINQLTHRMASMTWSDYQKPAQSKIECRCERLQRERLVIPPAWTFNGLEPAPRTKPKKQYKCGTCGELGHNSRTCTRKQKRINWS